MKNKIIQIDKDRRNYHKIISNLEWGNKENYHLCINTTGIELKTIISPLSSYIEECLGGNRKCKYSYQNILHIKN